jgi:hypothetical protein
MQSIDRVCFMPPWNRSSISPYCMQSWRHNHDVITVINSPCPFRSCLFQCTQIIQHNALYTNWFVLLLGILVHTCIRDVIWYEKQAIITHTNTSIINGSISFSSFRVFRCRCLQYSRELITLISALILRRDSVLFSLIRSLEGCYNNIYPI